MESNFLKFCVSSLCPRDSSHSSHSSVVTILTRLIAKAPLAHGVSRTCPCARFVYSVLEKYVMTSAGSWYQQNLGGDSLRCRPPSPACAHRPPTVLFSELPEQLHHSIHSAAHERTDRV